MKRDEMSTDAPPIPATAAEAVPAAAPAFGFSTAQLAAYFLRLGALGFGGPIALVGAMRRDLVERRGWVRDDEYAEGVALAQLAPGPLAAQLAIDIGWLRARIWRATLVAFAFVLPSFLMVLAISAAYLRFGGLPWMQGVFYGVGAAVIAIIALSAYKLVRKSVGRDWLIGAILAVNAAVTAATEAELIWLIVACGVVAMLVKAPPRFGRSTTALGLAALPAWLLTGLTGPAAPSVLVTIFLFFAAAGAFVFGSGLAIVPFLRGSVVGQLGWLTEQQFLDAVAVAMITPGPVVITVAFIGSMVAGPLGGTAAALGVFLPCYLFTVIPAPYFRRIAQNKPTRVFVDGVTAAATGAIAGAAFVLGRRAIIDLPTTLIALAVLGALLWLKKLPEPVLILAAGAAGVLIKGYS
jgi:chromate transporter